MNLEITRCPTPAYRHFDIGRAAHRDIEFATAAYCRPRRQPIFGNREIIDATGAHDWIAKFDRSAPFDGHLRRRLRWQQSKKKYLQLARIVRSICTTQ
jgi:hypothetical protein